MAFSSCRHALLVEDDDDDAELTTRAIAPVADGVVRVRNGAEALDYLFARRRFATRDLAEEPALVLLDWRIPTLSGPDVLRTIRAHDRTRHLPVVVLTGSDREDDLRAASRLLANCVLRKPSRYEDLAASARAIAHLWLAGAALPSASDY